MLSVLGFTIPKAEIHNPKSEDPQPATRTPQLATRNPQPAPCLDRTLAMLKFWKIKI